ncbi:hypothetical protein ACFQ3Z_26965 [Streptomyces nogalater]
MELGFRVRDAQGGSATSDALTRFLGERGIQAPVLSDDDTKAVLPRLDLLERMIETVGDCPRPPPPSPRGDPMTPAPAPCRSDRCACAWCWPWCSAGSPPAPATAPRPPCASWPATNSPT